MSVFALVENLPVIVRAFPFGIRFLAWFDVTLTEMHLEENRRVSESGIRQALSVRSDKG